MLSDYDVVPSPPSGQNYVFQTDILGASEYISSSLRRELESFLRRMGYKCQDITSNGFCIEIVFPYLLESEEHNKLDFIMKQFIRDKLATVRMEMIPNVSRENEEIIKTIVKRESKGYVSILMIDRIGLLLLFAHIRQIRCGILEVREYVIMFWR